MKRALPAALACLGRALGTLRARLTLAGIAPLAVVVFARRQVLAWATAMLLGASLGLMALVTVLLRPMRAQQLSDPATDPLHGWPEAGGEIGALSRVLRQAGAQRAAHARLQWAAHHDALTGLANRAAFGLQLQKAKAFDARPQSIPAVLVASRAASSAFALSLSKGRR